MSPDESAKIIGTLTAAYPTAKMSEETAAIYLRFLADLPYEAGQAAALQLISENKWFPSISEIRAKAIALLPGNFLPSAEEAWAEVSEKLAKSWMHERPEFSHPAIEQAVNAIGWTVMWMGENPAADRAHFLRIYENYRGRAERENGWPADVLGLLDKLEASEVKALPDVEEDA